MEFFNAILAPQNAFLRYALLTGLLASVACGIMGSYIVARRISYIAGGIAHCVLGGLGAAQFCKVRYDWPWLDPMYGAIASGILAAIIIGLVSMHAKEREDTIIGALWAIGMAVGVLFIYCTPGYNRDLMSYLFGNILMVSARDVWLVGALDALVVLAAALLYHQFLGVCFDEEFSRLRGMKVEIYYLFLLCLTALTVVLLLTVVGIIMVIALLTLPAAIAGQFAKTMWQMMGLATICSVVFTAVGLTLSYDKNLPSGATIIAVAGAGYLLALVWTRLRKRLAMKAGVEARAQ